MFHRGTMLLIETYFTPYPSSCSSLTSQLNPSHPRCGYIRILDFASILSDAFYIYHLLDKCVVRGRFARVQGHVLAY